MSTGTTLRDCFAPVNQHLKFILLDVIWRSIWLGCSVFGSLLVGFVLVGQLGSTKWEGPDLDRSSPIILLAALRQFWREYGATFLGELGLFFLTLGILWIVLEALFRGGRKGFWIYLGTSFARLSLLGGAMVFFGILARGDESGGTYWVGAVATLGLWFIVSLLETAIRRDALALLAVDFPQMVIVLGTLLFAEAFLAFVVWGSALAAGSSGIAVAGLIVAIVGPFWMVLHSYLIAVRFSAIDIMRRNVRFDPRP